MEIGELVKKQSYDFGDLCEIMNILRGENGCPWDREQTHKSIRKNLIEETYEVAEAIDCDDTELLCEELGDLMLQVVFHSKMAEEENRFNINDVCDGICKKLIVRHPHIFSDVTAKTSDEVLKNWEEIKKKTKSGSRKSAIDGIPPSLPSLMRASKACKKASGAGYITEDLDQAVNKIIVKAMELKDVCDNEENFVRVMGDLLFASADVSRIMDVDAEEALGHTVDLFADKFRSDEVKPKEKNALSGG